MKMQIVAIIALCALTITTSVTGLTMEQCMQPEYNQLTSCQLALNNPQLLKEFSNQVNGGLTTTLLQRTTSVVSQFKLYAATSGGGSTTVSRCSSWFISRDLLLYAREWMTNDLYELFQDPASTGGQLYSVSCRADHYIKHSCSTSFVVSYLPVFIWNQKSLSVGKKFIRRPVDCLQYK